MSQLPTTEEILQRLRAHVSHFSASESPAPPSAEPVSGNSSAVWPTSQEGAGGTPYRVAGSDFSRLSLEIDTALEGTSQVGQINPRAPGLVNAAIQFVKKVMRRSLTWYTRPIHYFQGGVIRALQQTLVLLRGHDESLQRGWQEISGHGDTIHQISRNIAAQQAATDEGIGALQKQISDQDVSVAELCEKVSAIVDDNSTLQMRMAALETQATSMENRTSSQSHQLAQARAQIEQTVGSLTDTIAMRLAEMDAGYTSRFQPQIDQQRQDVNRLAADLQEIKLRYRVRERDLRRFFHEVQLGATRSGSKVEENHPITPPMFPAVIEGKAEFDYFLFEERFRGDESIIAARQRGYLELFRGRSEVLDIGCGRGEFLELLRDNGIPARGIELGIDQYLLCQEKGLDVIHGDLFEYLESLADGSLGGVFSAQVIEHFAAGDQLRFVSLLHRKAGPGSPVVIETINAQCVFALTRSFFLDPSHVRPVHPETLKFAMESLKFNDVELRYSSPAMVRRIPPLDLGGAPANLAEFNCAIQDLNDLVYGYMDYAAIGWR